MERGSPMSAFDGDSGVHPVMGAANVTQPRHACTSAPAVYGGHSGHRRMHMADSPSYFVITYPGMASAFRPVPGDRGRPVPGDRGRRGPAHPGRGGGGR